MLLLYEEAPIQEKDGSLKLGQVFINSVLGNFLIGLRFAHELSARALHRLCREPQQVHVSPYQKSEKSSQAKPILQRLAATVFWLAWSYLQPQKTRDDFVNIYTIASFVAKIWIQFHLRLPGKLALWWW